MLIIVFGKPGAGKGTLADLINEQYGVKNISTGDILRNEVKKGTDLGKHIDSLINKGNFVSDDIVLSLIENEILSSGNLLLDGYPRNLKQAKNLDKMLCKINKEINHILYFNASDDMIKERILNRIVCPKCSRGFNLLTHNSNLCDKCNTELIRRTDDKEEFINRRLEIYSKETQPLVDYYKDRDCFTELDADKGINEVFDEFKNIAKNA
ncbi:adenylate kinase family protein [Alkaliphilus sp. B6464]|uniref:adenylate kinase family protein n=1 Tax=Alkaliphilus sp. B6464 TaxID=2731219 RepID=UPI001BA90418|nr:nucleoside monophosphate kinase [Alkaliphilus sp. B6464]QUH21794.1 nucleoside monophosphate kinase [Alkaliphilus sp. B6464]